RHRGRRADRAGRARVRGAARRVRRGRCAACRARVLGVRFPVPRPALSDRAQGRRVNLSDRITSPIEADRVVLTPLRVEDADEMVAVLASPTLYRFTAGEPPPLDALRRRYAALVV